jgi:hypothetical protein
MNSMHYKLLYYVEVTHNIIDVNWDESASIVRGRPIQGVVHTTNKRWASPIAIEFEKDTVCVLTYIDQNKTLLVTSVVVSNDNVHRTPKSRYGEEGECMYYPCDVSHEILMLLQNNKDILRTPDLFRDEIKAILAKVDDYAY